MSQGSTYPCLRWGKDRDLTPWITLLRGGGGGFCLPKGVPACGGLGSAGLPNKSFWVPHKCFCKASSKVPKPHKQ